MARKAIYNKYSTTCTWKYKIGPELYMGYAMAYESYTTDYTNHTFSVAGNLVELHQGDLGYRTSFGSTYCGRHQIFRCGRNIGEVSTYYQVQEYVKENVSIDSYLGEVVADYGTYPDNGESGDYWYIFSRMASDMKVNVNGSWRDVEQGYVNVNGVWRQGEIKANVNGNWP